jgi:Flp pilus assembly protein TadD
MSSTRPSTGLIVAFCALLALAGCQSAGVDPMETTAMPRPVSQAEVDLKAGKAQFEDGNYGLAEKHFRKAVEVRADSAAAWMGLAASYDQLGRFDFADRAYGELLKIAGRQPRIVNNMGYSQYLRGNKAQARKLYMEARAGMTNTAVVDANLKLLDKG